ncbi:MAG: DUF998 domain-containing protein [Halobacteriota archaeon]
MSSLQSRAILNFARLHTCIMHYHNVAGVLLFIAGVVAIMGIITSEAIYPGYSTRTNYISDLGSTRPPDGIVKQPAATIFAVTLIASGILTLGSAYCFYHSLVQGRDRSVLSILLALVGVSAIGVAAFNGGTEGSLVIHTMFAFLNFTAGGLAAIISYRIVRSPFRYFAIFIGATALVSFALLIIGGVTHSVLSLIGPGGVERWVSYPVVLWSIGFGGYLMGQSSPPIHKQQSDEQYRHRDRNEA